MSDDSNHPSCDYPAWRPPVAVRTIAPPAHPCAYLPGRAAQMRAFYVDSISPRIYHAFMDAGFRRSGKIVYQPICAGCRECLPIRVPVERFAPSKSHRRCRRRNADLVIEVGEPTPNDEKYELYRRYLTEWHGTSAQGDDRESFEQFLYTSPVRSLEFTYRDPASGRLVGVGICDICTASLSSVYFYFDPAESRRGIGTLGVLREIEFAQVRSIPYYYLGYWVNGCASMQYKSAFSPSEVLWPDGVWRELAGGAVSESDGNLERSG